MKLRKDNEAYWLRIRYPAVEGLPKYENWGFKFVQLDDSKDESREIIRYLKKLKREGTILDFMMQQIPDFMTLKQFTNLHDRYRRPKKGRKK